MELVEFLFIIFNVRENFIFGFFTFDLLENSWFMIDFVLLNLDIFVCCYSFPLNVDMEMN